MDVNLNRWCVIYRVGDKSNFKWMRTEWTESRDYAIAQADTMNLMGNELRASGVYLEAHTANWLDPLPGGYEYDTQ
jgi:hypothetical protein